MRNVDIKVQDGKAVITIDLKTRFGESKSGKSITVASTDGNVEIDGKVKIGINAYVAK